MNIFYGTAIPTSILVLKKPGESRKGREILFIDASQEFEHSARKNVLTGRQIGNIVKLYRERKNVDRRAHLATYEEIEENEYNLNVSSYVDTFISRPAIDFCELSERIVQTNRELEATKKSICASLQVLTKDDVSARQDLAQLFMNDGIRII